uniref:tRNA pseudouridine synthase B n=1 Tax=candidate division WOR-3 bacterium TaxID=2052148 RepID=A0A7C4YDW9_UNCW3
MGSKNVDGLLLLNKPKGITSTYALNIVKRILKVKKIGHGGTLDPFAEGLLLILMGKVTRFMEFYGEEKKYTCTIKLGEKTDTDDVDGKVIERKSIEGIDERKIEDVLQRFKGEIIQKVPLYSAVKIDGERLYRIAREGKIVDLPERKVQILELKIMNFEPPFLTIFAYVKKGVYIRSLARDIGDELGCGAYLHSLVREYVSPFSLKDAYTIQDVKKGNYKIIPLDKSLPHFTIATLNGDAAYKFRNGGTISGYYPDGNYIVRDGMGNILGIGKGDSFSLKPVRVLGKEN